MVQFDDSTFLEEGTDIAIAGYPLGTGLLTLPGYLHQCTPTLRKGVISAVLPFPCDYSHAFMIDVVAQGGASGYAVPSRLILSLMNTPAAQAWRLPGDAEHFDVLIERQRKRMRKVPGYE